MLCEDGPPSGEDCPVEPSRWESRCEQLARGGEAAVAVRAQAANQTTKKRALGLRGAEVHPSPTWTEPIGKD